MHLIIVYPETTEQLISIGSYAFNGCKGFEKIIIPDVIGERAFNECGDISELYIGRNTVLDDNFVFSSTNAENVFINIKEISASYLPSNIVNLKIGNEVKKIADESGDLSALKYSTETLESVILEEGSQFEYIEQRHLQVVPHLKNLSWKMKKKWCCYSGYSNIYRKSLTRPPQVSLNA